MEYKNNRTQTRRFFGMTNIFRSFLEDYFKSIIFRVLTISYRLISE